MSEITVAKYPRAPNAVAHGQVSKDHWRVSQIKSISALNAPQESRTVFHFLKGSLGLSAKCLLTFSQDTVLPEQLPRCRCWTLAYCQLWRGGLVLPISRPS